MITWYAVYTRPHGEARALENLVRQGYRAYLPSYKARVRHARRLQSVLRPLFPRYLFAGIDRTSMRWRPILSTNGVSDVVRAGGEPTPVPSDIVATLQEQELAGTFDRLGHGVSLRVGELVRITAGAFGDMIGQVVELRDQDRVLVLLELLGRTVRAQLEAEIVEVA